MKLKKYILLLLAINCMQFSFAQEEKLNIIVFGAHPDEADLKAGSNAQMTIT